MLCLPPPKSGAIITNTLDGAAYVYIPVGDFAYRPTITRTLNAFWIKQTEVTIAEYTRCMEQDGCPLLQATNLNERSSNPEHPIIDVTWEEANAYAQWVGGSLPTEEEWQKACGGIAGFNYPWGNELTDRDSVNVGRQFNLKGGVKTVASSLLDRGPYGLVDMSGNGREWTSSPSLVYPATAMTVRGGSWAIGTNDASCRFRTEENRAARAGDIGFRVVMAEADLTAP